MPRILPRVPGIAAQNLKAAHPLILSVSHFPVIHLHHWALAAFLSPLIDLKETKGATARMALNNAGFFF